MENLTACLNAVFPLFVLLSLGYCARRLGMLGANEVTKLNRALFRFFMPVMMFFNIYTSDLSSAIRPKLLLFAEAALLIVLAILFLIVDRSHIERSRKGVVIQGIYRSNFVLVGLPIVSSLIGDADLGPVVVLSAVVVPSFNAIAVIVLEYYGGEKTSAKKLIGDIFKNPLILGSIAGILALLVHLKLPTPIESAARQISQATTPVMLFLLGAFFRFDRLKNTLRELIWVCVGRLLLVPLPVLGAAALLGFRGVEFAALISACASSTAIASFTMAQQMGGDAELAGNIVVATNALCSFTLFLWCWLALSLGLI